MNHAELFNKSNCHQRTTATTYLKEYHDLFKWKKDATVVDIGCGDGSVTSIIAKSIPNCKSIIGVDISEDMIRFGKQHYSSECVDFMLLDIEKKLPDHLRGYFNHAVAFFALHWPRQQEVMFQNIYDLLKKDGNLFAIIVGQAALYDAYREMGNKEKWKPWIPDAGNTVISPYHDTEDPIKQITQTLSKVGFTITKLECKPMAFEYENEEQFNNAIKSLIPFKIPEELFDEFLEDFVEVMQKNDTMKYNFEKSTKEFVFNFQTIIIFIEKK